MTRSRKTALRIRRVYDPPAADDGWRVLVDRLWPRGLSKDRAGIDLWAKSLSPSDALRRSVHGDPGFPDASPSWKRFVTAYRRELAAADEGARREAIEAIRARLRAGPVTLLHASKNETRNNASALRDWLLEQK